MLVKLRIILEEQDSRFKTAKIVKINRLFEDNSKK